MHPSLWFVSVFSSSAPRAVLISTKSWRVTLPTLSAMKTPLGEENECTGLKQTEIHMGMSWDWQTYSIWLQGWKKGASAFCPTWPLLWMWWYLRHMCSCVLMLWEQQKEGKRVVSHVNSAYSFFLFLLMSLYARNCLSPRHLEVPTSINKKMCQAVGTVLIADNSLLICPFGGSDYRMILLSNHSCGS